MVETPVLVKMSGSGLMVIYGHSDLRNRTFALETPGIIGFVFGQSFYFLVANFSEKWASVPTAQTNCECRRKSSIRGPRELKKIFRRQ